MCRPDDFPPYDDSGDPYAEAREPVSEAALLRGHDTALRAAVDALGLPDCGPGCTCRGAAADDHGTGDAADDDAAHDRHHGAWLGSLGGQWVMAEDIPFDPVRCACGWTWTPAQQRDNEAGFDTWRERGQEAAEPADPRYAGMMPDGMYRALDADEAERFRQWARDNFQPGSDVNPAWHPVVRAECARIDAEASWERHTEATNR